ncbi:hypothetical protein LQW54_010190 [Pestalotiopsis sp. IQ-011]
MHNRVGRNSGKGGGRSQRNNAFDVHKTFGGYACKCAAWERAQITGDGQASDAAAALQLYRLTGDGQGIAGDLTLPGVLQASVILAASRKSLQAIIDNLEADSDEDAVNEDGAEHNPENDDGGGDEDDEKDDDAEVAEDADDLESADQNTRNRFATFEKNSFRSPKFWFQWSGTSPTSSLSADGEDQPVEAIETGSGYIVFTGNDCRKFNGTISCESLDWDNVAIRGHKIASRLSSDVPITWPSSDSAL